MNVWQRKAEGASCRVWITTLNKYATTSTVSEVAATEVINTVS